jgi:predicted HTH transcriptional regulator
MLDETKRLGLPSPQFRVVSGEFVVTFRKTPLPEASQSRRTSPSESRPEQLELDTLLMPDASSVPSKVQALNQKERMARAMLYVHEHGSILNREYQELTGASEPTAFRDLETLVEQGTLVRVGKTRGRRYKLP